MNDAERRVATLLQAYAEGLPMSDRDVQVSHEELRDRLSERDHRPARSVVFFAAVSAVAAAAVVVALVLGDGANETAPVPPAGTPSTASGIRDGQAPVVPNYGSAPDYVLELRANADEPKDPHGTLSLLGLSKDGLRQYEDFRGLSVWSGVSRDGTNCLLVAHPVQGLLNGIGDAQCSPDNAQASSSSTRVPLDTIADLTLCSGCSALRVFSGLPTGSLIRFVLADDRVDVYMYVRAPDPNSWEEQVDGDPG